MSLNLDLATVIWRSALPKGCSKLVLQCFTHHLNDESALSWPSISRVARMCAMSERTVQCHVRALQAAGLLRARVRTGRTTRYSIHLDGLAPLVFESDTVLFDAPDTASGPVDNSPPTPATFAQDIPKPAPQPAENDTKPVEICTLTLNRTLTELPGTAAPALPASALMIDSVKPEVLAGFAAIRKAKRKGAVTAAVIEEVCQQAHLAGLTLEQALQVCIERKWARFEAGWMQQSKPGSSAGVTTPTPVAALWKPPVSTPATPAVRAAELQRQRLLRQSPPTPPTPPAAPALVAGIQIGTTGPAWARGIVGKHLAGQHVSPASLRDACTVLKLTPASLRAATTN